MRAIPGQAQAGQAHQGVHRTIIVVDVERFGDHHRTNPQRLVVRDNLYRILETSLTKCDIDWSTCYREDRGDGILILIPPDVAKSVLIEHLPNHLMRLLDEYNAEHVGGERIRLRMAMHAGEIHYDAYGVVSEAVNHCYRIIDAPDLKAALANSKANLTVVTSDWFFKEVVRHCTPDPWKAYRPIKVVIKETDTTAWMATPGQATAADTASSRKLAHSDISLSQHAKIPEPQSPLWSVSDRSVRKLGARRTAYPLDLSIGELHQRGLYVPASFSDVTNRSAGVSIDELVTEIISTSSTLILGDPGSGKSVACYALLARLRKHTPAIAARLSELRSVLDPTASNSELSEALNEARTVEEQRPIVLVDGLDEALSEFESAADLSDLLLELSERFIIVATCRRREFEDQLTSSLDNGTFDSVFNIDEWTLSGQFTDFVNRLVAGGFLASDQLITEIKNSPPKKKMIRRPLYARMLTFLEQDGRSAVTDVSSLYAEYIDKLARSSDIALRRAGCRMPLPADAVWEEAAWEIFEKRLFAEERFDFNTVAQALNRRLNVEPRCIGRALSQICEQSRTRGYDWGQFVHYSFFEYLVSRYYIRQLRDAKPSGTVDDLARCLGYDPTPEIRHFIVGELKLAHIPHLTEVLVAAYQQMEPLNTGPAKARITRNLIIYILARAAGNGRTMLWQLLEGEKDMFLQQSILWGLCQFGDNTGLAMFINEARKSEKWRAWTRGYLMYYYGDIDRHVEPPYVDSDPSRSWERTRERSLGLMCSDKYREIAPQRRFLDLYLLYDYAIWRNEALSRDATSICAAELDALWHDSNVDGAALQELQAMHAATAFSLDG